MEMSGIGYVPQTNNAKNNVNSYIQTKPSAKNESTNADEFTKQSKKKKALKVIGITAGVVAVAGLIYAYKNGKLKNIKEIIGGMFKKRTAESEPVKPLLLGPGTKPLLLGPGKENV